ncbi:Mss4-like protein [Aspergillus ambiguus]|uniref:GFA family protein n=1 Tax=Aspergillus ambiguus TaxID=176160 RepID=UPI003CCCB39C
MGDQTLSGACLCRNIAYSIDLPASEPTPKVVLCHCTSCKRYTGSGFSSNIIVPFSALKYTAGTPKLYFDPSDRGPKVRREFCGDCGTPLSSQPADTPHIIIMKSGTLDDEHREKCGKLGMEIFCGRKDRWVDEIQEESVQRLERGM